MTYSAEVNAWRSGWYHPDVRNRRLGRIVHPKYLHIKEDSIMDTNDEQQEPSDDDDLETLRSIIRQSLNEIANDIGTAMRDAHLNFPVGLTCPSSGCSVVTMVTPVDPSDDDWARATSIVRQIVTGKLGGVRLRSRPLPCAMVSATMGAAEVTTDPKAEPWVHPTPA